MSKQDKQARRLWKKFKKHWAYRQQRGCPDEAMLAAYIDGVISGHESDLIESHFVYCPHCLSSFLAIRESHEDIGEHPSPALIRQLESLEPERHMPAHRDQIQTWNRREALFMRLRYGMGWAAAAAFIIITSMGGYLLGKETFLLRRNLEKGPAVEAPITFETPITGPFTEDVL